MHVELFSYCWCIWIISFVFKIEVCIRGVLVVSSACLLLDILQVQECPPCDCRLIKPEDDHQPTDYCKRSGCCLCGLPHFGKLRTNADAAVVSLIRTGGTYDLHPYQIAAQILCHQEAISTFVGVGISFVNFQSHA